MQHKKYTIALAITSAKYKIKKIRGNEITPIPNILSYFDTFLDHNLLKGP